MKKTFYVTTPIYYASGDLHIGHTYTTVLADIMNRYKKLMGYETFFLTGSDEHGQKIATKALAENLSPKNYVDKIVEKFKNLWNLLDVDYDKFIRTTDDYHKKAVQEIFSKLVEKDLIYKGSYKGLYCVSCEEFLTSEQINEEGLCKVSQTKPEILAEETYFLRVSQFSDFLTKLFDTNFLTPESRKNEMLKNFIEPGLEDLSVTRISLEWGIPTNEDPKHVIYVWIDALSNYITALGYGQSENSLLKKFWNSKTEIVQYVGKEITRFHSIYWPVILEGLGLPMPTKLISHGWILAKDTKMSKSLGNVIDPIAVINGFSSDALRFYIAKELPTERDGNFTEELFIESYNTNLANNIGNLISRTNNMIVKYFDGNILEEIDLANHQITNLKNQMIANYIKEMNDYQIHKAVDIVMRFSQELNKFIEDEKPWALEKSGDTKNLAVVLKVLQESIAVIIHLLSPILTKSYSLMLNQIGYNKPLLNIYELESGKLVFEKINDRKIIFERIN
ncbi:methionyl-tRNA synthetase [Spiroplasma sabaudiense Ar-1343]|uniref:Methionine--tRNA ligase n=1 Tax=Spiroplasma sabaudiense Ar-1343 TaxID=1276257 RepID=W6AAQ3_9MOLU|nr:methionine--tRNA ligase [Spiroplasma sabaudiense]AHI54233.1 methionyl-tRNA synthetase [Spiroplasma sabaudiense Ar-1343]